MTDDKLQTVIDRIIIQHRNRCYWMKQRISIDQRLGAQLRTLMGWNRGLPRNKSERIKAEAKHVITSGQRYITAVEKATKPRKQSGGNENQPWFGGDAHGVPLPPELEPYVEIVLPTLASRNLIADKEKEPTKIMRILARQLPVWSVVKDWRGFDALGLSIIIGEAGNLSEYANDGKLHKRLGIVCIDGIKQGGLPKGASKEEWKKHGYNPRRRERIYAIAGAMIIHNERIRTIYKNRKVYERACAEAAGLTIDSATKIKKLPKEDKAKYRSLKHIDQRAKRYATQHMITDLWWAWHRASATPGQRQLKDAA